MYHIRVLGGGRPAGRSDDLTFCPLELLEKNASRSKRTRSYPFSEEEMVLLNGPPVFFVPSVPLPNISLF